MSGLFDDLPPAKAAPRPAAQPKAAPVAAQRPMTWRAPDRPREEPCAVCAGAACYGDGATWFCRTHIPNGFLPHTRTA